MKVLILRRVPVLLNDKAVSLAPGIEVDGLSDSVIAALVRGGDAEEVKEEPIHVVMDMAKPGSDETVVHQTESLFPRKFGKKNRGAAPENK